MTGQRCAGSNGGRRTAIAVSLAALSLGALFPGDAGAAELTLPHAKPAVALEIPDDWAIDKSGKGLDGRSPEKNAIVVAEVISRDKAVLEAWSKQASAKLKAFGIAFDEKAKAPPKPPAVEDESAFTKSPDKFTFSGTPSLATPGTPGSNDPVKPGKSSIEALTGLGSEVKPQPTQPPQPMSKLPFRAVQYYGTTLNGKPVDVQLVIYNLPDKRALVMMQESGPDDSRTVAIAASVRGVKPTPAKAAPRRAPKPNRDAKSSEAAPPAQESPPTQEPQPAAPQP